MRDHRFVKAGVALAAASAVAVTPVASVTSWPSPLSAVERAVHLVADDGSLLNVPINLLTDLVNIPANEINNLGLTADSFFSTGSWFIPSASNVWGTDPGDLAHYLVLLNGLLPFPELSYPLAQQIMGLTEAELPASPFCDAEICAPLTPVSPITGNTLLDELTWVARIFTGQAKFPLLDNWLQVPLSELQDGYHFGDVVDPSGAVHAGFSPDPSVDFAFAPTTPFVQDGAPVLDNYGRPEELMPWANTTFTLDLSKPFTNFFNSLTADPSMNPIELPDLMALARNTQALLASLVVDFYPFVAGSPLCPGACTLPESLTVPGLVQAIGNLWPGNQAIDEWLTAWQTWGTDDQTVNWATPDQVANLANVFHALFNLDDSGNPPYDGSDPQLPDGPLPVLSGPCGAEHVGGGCDFGQPWVPASTDPDGGASDTGMPDIVDDQWWSEMANMLGLGNWL